MTTEQERDLSFAPIENAAPRVLTTAHIEAYNRDGYVKPFRIFDEAETRANRSETTQKPSSASAPKIRCMN